MRKQLPSEQGRRQWLYTAHSKHYSWSTIVVARTIQEARGAGYREARMVFGNHASIQRDEVKEYGT
jgi:hypothetical protein